MTTSNSPSTQEVVTEPLTSEQLRAGTAVVSSLLQAWHNERADVSYGIMCDLPPEQLWEAHEIPSSSLLEFVQQSEDRGVFRLGSSDLWIADRPGSFKFRLCHESDIHFTTDSEDRLRQVIEAWRAQGFKQYVGASAATGVNEWKLIDPQESSRP